MSVRRKEKAGTVIEGRLDGTGLVYNIPKGSDRSEWKEYF